MALKALHRALRWLRPGLGVKRWLALLLLGLAIVAFGAVLSFNLFAFELISIFGGTAQAGLVGALAVVGGIIVVALSLSAMARSIARALLPDETELVDRMWSSRRLGSGLRVVALGGGTGLSSLLRGLKRYTTNITAIVVVSDDGGSSGRLQKELPTLSLPPGDIRNCLAALADEEPLMTRLLQYRFAEATAPDLAGHSFGNLLIAALEDITGDFEEAIRETSRVLAIRGKVLPPTLESVRLCARLLDGRNICGETNIASSGGNIDYVYLDPAAPEPLQEALDAIAAADLIVIGPGSLYTSVIPNLLVPRVAETIAASQAIRAFVCNVMTQPGETTGMASAVSHVEAIQRHVSHQVFDYVVLNNRRPPRAVQQRYDASGAEFVTPEVRQIARLGYLPVEAPLLADNEMARHNPEELAKLLVGLAE